MVLSKKEFIKNEIIRRWVSKRRLDFISDEDIENHEADDASWKKKRKTEGEGIIVTMERSEDRFYDLKEWKSQKRFELWTRRKKDNLTIWVGKEQVRDWKITCWEWKCQIGVI